MVENILDDSKSFSKFKIRVVNKRSDKRWFFLSKIHKILPLTTTSVRDKQNTYDLLARVKLEIDN